MKAYQRIKLPEGTPVGEPGPLPAVLVGLEDSSLADLSWTAEALGHQGYGYIPAPEPQPPSPDPRSIPRLEFMQRLTPEMRIAIRQAGKTDVVIEDFLDILSATPRVNLDSPIVAQGLQYCVSKGLMTQAQSAELLA